MAVFELLTLEFEGTFDHRAALRLVGELEGIVAKRLRIDFRAVESFHGASVQVLASVLPRLCTEHPVVIAGLPLHVANTLERLSPGAARFTEKRAGLLTLIKPPSHQ